MKIAKIQPKTTLDTITCKPAVKKAVALAVPLIASTKEAAAHAAPFFHMHDSHGKTIGMAAGVLFTIGSIIAGVIAINNRYGKTNNSEEKVDKK